MVTANILPAKERLLALLEYFPETGILRWRQRATSDFVSEDYAQRWNKKYSGKPAGHNNLTKGRRSCVQVCIDYKSYRAHRLILSMLDIDVPTDMVVDHIDGDPWNNRIENLRVVPQQTNMTNVMRRQRSGRVQGVYHRRGSPNPWVAKVVSNGRQIQIGQYPTKGLAAVARAKKELMLYGSNAPVLRG